MDATTATFRAFARSRRASTTTQAVVESRPDVGSSQQSSRGFVSISWPTMRRFRSPPDTPRSMPPPTMASAQCDRRRSSMHSSTCRSFSASVASARRSRAEKTSVSRMVRPGNTRSSCSMNATWRFSALDHARSAPYQTLPPLTGPRRAMALSRLVLPQPVGPMSAVSSPAGTSPLHGARATTSLKRTDRLRKWTLSSMSGLLSGFSFLSMSGLHMFALQVVWLVAD
mmetsp:Transcript_3345/g.11579  ORF Transcript_3345/g.11579 Transcript_3345/m.11579 type:complete len:227 (+) Transcript_3345:1370-2050(+)